MFSAALYAHVRTSSTIAHETAGAARTRHSLRPLFFVICQVANFKDSGIFRFYRSANRGIFIAIPSRPEGRSRSSRPWDGDAVDADAPVTNGAEAYGEDVWS